LWAGTQCASSSIHSGLEAAVLIFQLGFGPRAQATLIPATRFRVLGLSDLVDQFQGIKEKV